MYPKMARSAFDPDIMVWAARQKAAKQPPACDIWWSSLLETTIYRMSEKHNGLLSGSAWNELEKKLYANNKSSLEDGNAVITGQESI